jgi:hypothetical protein
VASAPDGPGPWPTPGCIGVDIVQVNTDRFAPAGRTDDRKQTDPCPERKSGPASGQVLLSVQPEHRGLAGESAGLARCDGRPGRGDAAVDVDLDRPEGLLVALDRHADRRQ